MDFTMNRRNFVKAASLAGAASLAAGATAAFADEAATATPKYIFLFIGDGMGNEQVQIASFFKGATENDGAVVQSPLTFMGFPHVGSVTTYDSTSFCPDSASTATSIATGNKTKSGTINMDPETLTQPFETISEKLHSQKGYKVGVLSTVNMNHATPAAFYAHQDSRKNYYAIGQEMTESGFEVFAGGAWLAPTDKDEDKTDLNELAAQAGYTVATTQADAQALGADSGNVLIIAETLADGDAMNYELDAAEGEWRFADYVKKGIECLGDEQPFFMMAEGAEVTFADAMADVKECFGLMLPEDTEAADADPAGQNGSLVLTPYEVAQLQDAFTRTLEVGGGKQAKMSQQDYELYGTYQPFSMAVCHILDAKSGITHGTYAHTGAPVNIYAMGCGSELFDGAFDNTEIFNKLAQLTQVD